MAPLQHARSVAETRHPRAFVNQPQIGELLQRPVTGTATTAPISASCAQRLAISDRDQAPIHSLANRFVAGMPVTQMRLILREPRLIAHIGLTIAGDLSIHDLIALTDSCCNRFHRLLAG